MSIYNTFVWQKIENLLNCTLFPNIEYAVQICRGGQSEITVKISLF